MGKKFAKETVERWKELYKAGHTFEQIGGAFSTSGKTVSKHIKNLEKSVKPEDSTLNSAPNGNSAGSGNSFQHAPEIVELRKQLEIAKLKREIRQAESPLEIETRLAKLERQISQHDKSFSHLVEWMKIINQWKESINQNLAICLELFECTCGAQGEISISCRCKNCYEEYWLG